MPDLLKLPGTQEEIARALRKQLMMLSASNDWELRVDDVKNNMSGEWASFTVVVDGKKMFTIDVRRS